MVTGEGPDSAEPSSEDALESAEDLGASRFENYELLTGEDGKPIELGRGAMGITYKGLDIDLQCPVTLKVISEKYLGDESARLRFVREARAAASVRHPNVASVFHLGRRGRNYFYAMEFVEGETLESLIKRSGRLKNELALEITSQVASGLAGIAKQKLVHRDIKPSIQHPGEFGGRRSDHGEDYRPGSGEADWRPPWRSGHFDTRRLCRDTRVCQPRAVCWSGGRYPFGPLFARGNAFGKC